MSDTSNKFREKRSTDAPELGNFINWHFQENNIKKKKVSDFLGILPTTLNQYFKQSSFQFAILWRISLAVQYNFLMALGERLNIAYETKAEKALKIALAEKQSQLENLEIQLQVFKQIHKIE